MASSKNSSTSVSFSYDIGHSSIGWAVLAPTNSIHPKILGSGVVTFPSDDCLASKRRDHRRTRRHIRSTRQRIERLKRWLEYRGVLTRKELDLPGHPAPFLLVAAALNNVRKLTALELWHTLRWYAHNRGYDGNSRWSKQEENSEDTEKVKNAKQQLNELGTETMAETICELLKLKPNEVDKRISSFLPYKTLNTAYPRHIVTAEVSRLLAIHCDLLDGLDQETCDLIFPDRELSENERSTLLKANIKLPKRYHGGLLFGQLVPRFDNRIISRCPITWAKIYQQGLADGKDEKEAKRLAERDAKVPTKKCPEFLEYRLARILANLKADNHPISAEARKAIFEQAQNQGRLNHRDLETIISQHHPNAETNIHTYFKLHPDSEEALVFDPVMHELHKAKGSRAKLSPYWKFLPESADPAALELWKKGDSISLEWITEQVTDPASRADLESEIEKQFKKAKKNYADIQDFCQFTKASVKWPSGRAPFARPVLRKVTEEVLSGYDSTKANSKTDPDKGEIKDHDGILYELSVQDSEVNQLLQKRPLTKLTNNPLVRHRLLILERLLEDMISEYAPDEETKITEITVEVAREIKELSGKSAKEIASELNGRLKDFKAAVSNLEKFAPTLPITGGLIRKCRIAMDMNWHCPFTGKLYEPHDLPYLELEHIIPFSARKTNALHALVLTWPEVNRWKANRTARQFIIDEGGKTVPNKGQLSLLTEVPYRKLVDKLDTKGHDDDQKRKRSRKALLDITIFEEKEQGFTDGSLTQSSHIIKLAMRSLRKRLPKAKLHSIPGIATGEIRKSWSLLGTLGHPEVCGNEAMRWMEKRDRETGDLITDGYNKFPALETPDPENKKAIKAAPKCPNDECEQPLSWPENHNISETHCPHCHAILRRVPKAKEDIRSLTHLHHALDALTIGLVTHYFPLSKYGQNQSGKIWKALVTRSRSEEEKTILRSTKLFNEREVRSKKDISKVKTEFRLKPLTNDVKEQVITHLAKGRVIQHVPADYRGATLEQNQWRVRHISNDQAVITQWLTSGTGNKAVSSEISQDRQAFEYKRKKQPAGAELKNIHELIALCPEGTFSQQELNQLERGVLKITTERTDRIVGLKEGKLKDNQAALVIENNYAIAILEHLKTSKDEPTILTIPYHDVQQRILDLKRQNNNLPIKLIKNGSLLKIPSGRYKGIWRFVTIDRLKPFTIKVAKPAETKFSTTMVLATAIKHGLEILSPPFTGEASG